VRRRKKFSAVAPFIGLVLAFLSACAAAPPVGASHDDGVVTSNVLRRDYAGSASCRPCHPTIYDAFMASPMHNMTRHAEVAEVHAPFDGTVFRFKDDAVTMEEHGGRKYMRVERQGSAPKIYRITKVIGGHYREDFVGQQVSGTADDASVVAEAAANG
jgi:hypothetical protein